MYIIIFDRGGIGYGLAKALLEENNEVLVLEHNADVCE